MILLYRVVPMFAVMLAATACAPSSQANAERAANAVIAPPAPVPTPQTPTPRPSPASPAPEASADGPAATVTIAGLGPVTVQPLHIAKGNASKCLVALSSPGQAQQRIVVIGEGETEALGCGHIIAFGQVPAPAGQARIAFLYRAYSPNTMVLQPVFTERAIAGGLWTTNDDLAQSIGEVGALTTIPKIRAYLARAKQ